MGQIPQKFADLLYQMDEMGSGDAQLHPDSPVWYRIGGTHRFADKNSPVSEVSADDMKQWLEFTAGVKENPLGPNNQISRAVDVGDFRARATFRLSVQGITASIRLIPEEPPTCEEVGVDPVIQQLTKKTSGLIICEGPTGSGKTTLLNAMLDKINKESDRHIYTIEDPVEFIHKPVGATTIVNREVGYHVPSYVEGVKDALRSKPDVIYMGELRDPETTKAALHAATTGHLVMTTAHSGSVTEAIQSLIGQFTADEQPQIRQRLAVSLLAIICQKLVLTKNPEAPLAPAQEVMFNSGVFPDSAGGFRSMILQPDSVNQIHAKLDSNDNKGWMMEKSLAWLVVSGVIDEKVGESEAKDVGIFREKLAELKASPAAKETVKQQQKQIKQAPKAPAQRLERQAPKRKVFGR